MLSLPLLFRYGLKNIHANISVNQRLYQRHNKRFFCTSSLKKFQDYMTQHWDDAVVATDPLITRLLSGIASGSRSSLAEAITLVESSQRTKRAQAEHLLTQLLLLRRQRMREEGLNPLIFRIGISGSPGVGKSSFIETFGLHLIKEHGKKVAVLTIDPSSITTGGSILGDITRMPELSRNENAYVRTSPTRGKLGGIAKGTHEAVYLCEGAGYDVVLIETVGVGQSEVDVAKIVDMVVLLISPAGGDELQGFKRGIVELCDLILVTKADGSLVSDANRTQGEYLSALKFVRPRFRNWRPSVLKVSAHTNSGIDDAWREMSAFWHVLAKSGDLLHQRERQMIQWMWEQVQDDLLLLLRTHPDIIEKGKEIEKKVAQGTLSPGAAARSLLHSFLGS